MSEKVEWRKKEKHLYLPKSKPEVVDVPAFNFISLSGEGSPAAQQFSDTVGALYSLAYGLKMQLKRMEPKPKVYYDYTVYPLEGVWDINESAKKTFDGTLNKEDFVYDLMIRQPDFISTELFSEILEAVQQKKPDPLLAEIKFKTEAEGLCVQMLHVGSYDNEPQSFDRMERFSLEKGLFRISKIHREIYLSDARKVAPEKLKTVLRYKVNKLNSAAE